MNVGILVFDTCPPLDDLLVPGGKGTRYGACAADPRAPAYVRGA